MDADTRSDVLKRLGYVEGHLAGVRRMIEEDTYCVDVLKQTYAVRRAIEKAEAKMLDDHLRHCFVAAIEDGDPEPVLVELLALYELASK